MENIDERLVDFFLKDKPLAEAFECLFENASDAIYILNKKGNFVTVNRKAEELTGFRREDFVGKSFRRIIPNKSLPKAIRGFLDVIRGKEVRLELEIKRAANKTVLVEVTSRPIIVKGKIVGTLGIVRDVTERVQMENKLKETNRKLQMLFDTAMEGIIVVDAEENLIFVNNAFADMLGYEENELIGTNLQRLVNERDFKEIRRQTESRKKGKVSRYELVMFGKDGKPHIFQVSASPLWNEDGSFAGALSIVMDITERRQMEEALRESEEKFRAISNFAKDAIISIDDEGRISFWNPAAEKMFGYKKEEAIGKEMYKLIPGNFYEAFQKGFSKFKETGTGPFIGRVIELVLVSKSGVEIPVELSLSAYKMKGKWHSMSIARDITERKQMQKKLEEYSQQLEQMVEKRTRQLKEAQEQLIKSERLAAIGQVAAMVGHDLRNPLTSMSGATYYLKTKLGSRMDEKTREMFELIEKDIQHANKIITDLLEYSREIRLEMTETTPKSIIKEALSLVEIPKNVKVIDSTQNEPKIKMDIDKMKRVFANIIKNAVEAMPKGGKLTISTKESDNNVAIMFIDTGIGIAKEAMEKIWTPFFTTKAEGMGLGLPICKRVIEAHDGKISVESIVGEGTTFTVTIPVEPKPKEEGGEKVWVNVPESLSSTTTKA